METKPLYKTAEELGIEEKTRRGLIDLARDLADGTVRAETFWMGTSCGSACCLVGHLVSRKAIGRRDEMERMLNRHPLCPLFYPRNSGIACRDPIKGAAATLNFLVTGDPQ